MGETDVNQMVSSEVLGEQTMGTYLGSWGVAQDGLQILHI